MTAVYNEFDPFAAQWLRNLITAGHIAPGDVDERDLWDVAPDDWRGYDQVHVCAGIGVWSYALRNAGWPDARPIWTASLPCQPFSAAGKGLGFADERHLWPAFFHLVTHLRPDRIVGEQVASKDGLGWFDLVHADLEAADYACRAVDLCAAGVGAPHIRQRLWWHATARRMADADGRDTCAEGLQRSGEHRQFATDGGAGGVADAQSIGRNGRPYDGDGGRRECAPGQDGAAGGMEHAEGDGREQRRSEPSGRGAVARCGAGGMGEPEGFEQHGRRDAGRGRGEPTDAGVVDRLADSVGQGLEGRDARKMGNERKAPERGGETRRVGNPLTGFAASDGSGTSWVLCNDPDVPKWRPVESGAFPLAYAVTNRVGKLRAYGNALDAEAAEAFLRCLP